MIIRLKKYIIKKILGEQKFAKIVFFTAILLLALSSFFYMSCPVFATEEKSPINIGISYFANQTGQSDWSWLSKELTDKLINHLSLYDSLNVASKNDVEEFYWEQELFPDQTEMKKPLLIKFHEVFGSEIIIFGSFYYSSPSEISLSLKKYEQHTGQITAFRDFTIDETKTINLANILNSFILKELNIEENKTEKSVSKKLSTNSIEALANYNRSLDYKDRAIAEYEGVDFPSKELWAKAIEYGEKAVADDPEYADAYFLLAEIYNKTRWTIREANSLNRFIELVEINQLESEDIYEKASQAYFRLGYSFYSKKEFEKAIEYFNSSIKYNPDLLEPHIYLTQLYYDIGEIGLSIDESEEVLRIDPQNKDISWLIKKSEKSQKIGREAYEYYEKGYLSYKEGNYDMAVKNFEQSIAYNSKFKESHYYLALVFYELADFNQAIEQWNEAIKLDPFDNSAKHFLNRSLEEKEFGRETLKYFNVGYEYYLNGEYEKAIEAFNKSLEMNAEFEKARKYLSRSYYQLDQMDKYREERGKASDLTSNSEDGKAEEHYKLGYEFYSLGDYQVAIEELNKALDLITDYPAARYLLAEVFFKQENYVEARVEYDKVISDSENNEYTDDALFGSGWSYYLLEEYALAAERFSKLIMEFPESNLAIQAKYKLGKAYFQIKDYSKVVKVYNDFIRVYPQFQEHEIQEIYYLLGQANLLISEYSEAERIFKKLILLYPEFEMISQTKYYLGLNLFKQKRYDEAIINLKELITSEDIADEQKAEMQYLLSRCYLNTGEINESIRNIEILKKSVKDDSLLEKISFDLGLAYSLQGDKERAVLEFQKFIEKYFQSDLIESAHFELGKNLFDLKKYKLVISELEGMSSMESLYLIGKSAEELGDREKEISAFSELRKKYPESEFAQEAYFQLGIEYYDKKMYKEAISEFNQMIQVFPNSPFIMESYYWMGWTYFKLADYSKAKDYFKKVNPTEVETDIARKSQFMAAEALYKIKEFSLAREEYRNYIRQYPQSEVTVNAQYAIAWTHLESNEIQSSVNEFRKIVDQYSDSEYVEESKFRIAKGDMLLDKMDNAENELENFIDEYTKSAHKPEAFYLLTQMYLGEEKWIDNILWSERAIREIPDSPYLSETLYGLCISYFKKDEYKKTIKNGEIYLEKYSDSQFADDILYITGICWEQLENSEKAIYNYQRLIDNYLESTYIKKVKERLIILQPGE